MLIEDYNLICLDTSMEETKKNISNQSQVILSKNVDQKLSACGVMKDATLELIQKIESEVPILFQEYSNLYTRYLHSIRDVYGVCSLAENEYFKEMEIDQNFLKIFDSYFKFGARVLESQIHFSTNYLRSYLEFRLSYIDSWDKYSHACINMYAKSLSQTLQGRIIGNKS